MGNTETGAEQTTVQKDGVEVSREIIHKSGGIVGTIKIQSQRDKPILVHVVEEFPADLPIEEIAFKPGSKPENGTITTDSASIKQTLTDDPVEIVYGIKLSASVGKIEFAPPTIQSVDFMRGSSTRVADNEDSSQPSSKSDISSGFFSHITEKLSPSTSKSEQQGQKQSSSTTPERRTEETSNEHADTDSSTTSGESGEQTTHPPENNDEGMSETNAASKEDSVEALKENPGEANEPAKDETESNRSIDDGSSPTAPAKEEESIDERESPPPRNIVVRLDRLSARVEEFAAYAGALEEIINEHGTATEIIDRFERNLEDLEDRLQTTRKEIAEMEKDHDGDIAELQDTTTQIEDRLDSTRETFDSEIETVRDELGDVEETVDRVEVTTERLETDINQHGSDLAAVSENVDSLDDRGDEMESELNTVRGSVQSVERDLVQVSDEIQALRDELETFRGELDDINQFRDTLANAFGGGTTLEASESTEPTTEQNVGPNQSPDDDEELENGD